jgi:hypothetical protein
VDGEVGAADEPGVELAELLADRQLRPDAR